MIIVVYYYYYYYYVYSNVIVIIITSIIDTNIIFNIEISIHKIFQKQKQIHRCLL